MTRAGAARYSAVTLGILLGGCVLSVHPVVPESAATFDERLIGAWEEVDGSDHAVVSRGAGNSYAIDYTSDGKTTPLSARLGRVGGHTVLDVWPSAPASAHHDLPGALLVPVHLLVTLQINTDGVAVALLEADSMAAALESGAVKLDHEVVGERLILSGPTDELHAALRAHLGGSGALSKATTFRRRRSAGAARAAPGSPREVPAPLGPGAYVPVRIGR